MLREIPCATTNTESHRKTKAEAKVEQETSAPKTFPRLAKFRPPKKRQSSAPEDGAEKTLQGKGETPPP